MDIRSVSLQKNEVEVNDSNSHKSVERKPPVSGNESVTALDKNLESDKQLIMHTKAVFAIDDNKNVVIQVLDEDGKVIKQLPPDDYLDMVKKIKESMTSHYDIVA